MPGVGLGEFEYLKRINLSPSMLTIGLRNLVQNFPRFSGFVSAPVLSIGEGRNRLAPGLKS